jgi:endonuclease/exonuclease/phosphatase family metal-dependent hydrolase
VASVHLPLEERQRLEHARRVLAVRRTLSAPYALAAGDINERPGGPAWRTLSDGGLRDLDPRGDDTYPAVGPRKRIDGALASDGVEVVDVQVLGGALVERASDHRPLVVTVRVPSG